MFFVIFEYDQFSSIPIFDFGQVCYYSFVSLFVRINQIYCFCFSRVLYSQACYISSGFFACGSGWSMVTFNRLLRIISIDYQCYFNPYLDRFILLFSFQHFAPFQLWVQSQVQYSNYSIVCAISTKNVCRPVRVAVFLA